MTTATRTTDRPHAGLRGLRELLDCVELYEAEAEELERFAATRRRADPKTASIAEAEAEGCRIEARRARRFAR